jgi:hypothetical protein
MAGRGRDLERIDELLAEQVLMPKERAELYELAKKRNVDIRRKRLNALLSLGGLFDDDVEELRKLCSELGCTVKTVRIDFQSKS